MNGLKIAIFRGRLAAIYIGNVKAGVYKIIVNRSYLLYSVFLFTDNSPIAHLVRFFGFDIYANPGFVMKKLSICFMTFRMS